MTQAKRAVIRRGKSKIILRDPRLHTNEAPDANKASTRKSSPHAGTCEFLLPAPVGSFNFRNPAAWKAQRTILLVIGILPAMNWAHAGPSMLASFLASAVECVEALTVVLAVGSVRGWSGALAGAGAALALLLALVAVLGRALTRIPLHTLQLVVGVLLLLFGLRWLRKAILRSAGQIPLHNEEAAFAKNTASMQTLGRAQRWDRVAFATAFQITMLEGTEVVFIVVAVGAGGVGLLFPASIGAVAALLLVIALGIALHRPLANVPENTLKFVVGVLLSAFGTFWVGEGANLLWPGGDWSILGLVAGYLVVAVLTVAICRSSADRRRSATGSGMAAVK